jgi:hypothetical protein
MQLLQQLHEASSLQISDLKKAMQKDKRAAVLFKKDLSLDDIEDKDAFLATLKYYVLNNENVRNFVAMRHNVKDVDKETLKGYRSLRGKDLDANKLKWLKEFIQDVFKEASSVDRGTLSPDLKRELKDWVNGNGRYFNLPAWAQRELMAIPSLRPDKRVLLYRGVLFKEYDLKEKESYDGTMEEGNGLKFLRSIKKGTREIELTWDRPSSWSYNRDIADRFAQYGPASSNYAATLQWLDRSMQKKHIDGALGFVISTFANPEDILLDMNRFNVSSQHGNEAEVILKPGTYLARIVKKYTVDAGEVDPTIEPASDSPVGPALETVKQFAASFKLPEGTEDILSDRKIWTTDALDVLKYPAKFKKLILNSTTTEVVHAFDKLMEFYNSKLKHLSKEDMAAEKFAHDKDASREVQKLRDLIDRFTEKARHSKFKSDKNARGEGKKHDLSGEEYRSTISAFDLRELEKDLLTRGVISSREAGHALTVLSNRVKGQLPTSARIQQFGAAKQIPIIDEIVKKFFEMVGLDKPADRTEAMKMMINLIRKAHRNHVMMDELSAVKKKLEELA